MTVAIITRTKNRTILLKRAIESILQQTYQDWVHVIVNDGGEQIEVDSLIEQYKDRYQGRLKVLHHPQSLGMEAASNAGLNASDSEFIVIHDDDDSWHKTFLTECINHLKASTNPKAQGVICHSIRVSEEMKNTQVSRLDEGDFNTWIRQVTLYQMLKSNMFPPISFIFSREALKIVGLFDETLPVLGDWDFHLRFLMHYDIECLPKRLAYYHHRIHIKSADNNYGNTIIASVNKHEYYKAMLLNRYLRQDLQTRQMGVGVLLNIVEDLNNAQHDSQVILHHIKQLKKLFFYGSIRKIVRFIKRIPNKKSKNTTAQ